MKKLIISAIAQNQARKNAALSAAQVSYWFSLPYRVSYSLFWSVFGPAAQYGYRMSNRYCRAYP